jgi:hypothetical protein
MIKPPSVKGDSLFNHFYLQVIAGAVPEALGVIP